MKLQTVNVIELFSGIFESVDSFTDDAAGNKEAKEFFANKLKDNDFVLMPEELLEILNDGCFECGKFELLLTHSV
jgi:hypothetical protein